MATIGNDSNGRKRLLFVAGDGSRKTVRIGKATTRQAEAFKLKVEALIGSTITGSVDDEVSRWLAGLPDAVHARLAAVGLVKPRASAGTTTLKGFIDAYIAGRTDVKPNTLIGLGQARRNLLAFFGDEKPLAGITEGDADEYWRYLVGAKPKGAGLSGNTARRLCGRAKQFFRFAQRKRIITGNPFTEIASGVNGNAGRQFFVTRDVADKVNAACPDAQWRLIFALSRFGGLRCPSEHLALKWSDVDWDRNRLRVPSPKTEHIEGHESRIIPLFPELRGPLLEVFEQAEPGVEHVITRYRDGNQNLRTHFERIIRRAGLEPWPKLFHNLRATRQTGLAETFPIHVVCKWIGNSAVVAKEHYLQVTDSHFRQATLNELCRAAQTPAQSASELTGTARKPEGQKCEKHAEKAVIAPMPGGGAMASIGVEPILLLGNGF
jgi:integrase